MKKLFVLLLTLVIVFSISACGSQSVKNEDTSENSKNSVEDNTSQQEATDSTESFLTTEYEVVDYVENAIIVSKNDGLLYGLIDNKGNEIIPVKYDEMEFFNKDDYVDGYYDIYIGCCYESTEYIYDVNGNKLLESEESITYAPSVIKDNDTPVFKIGDKLYDKNLDIIGIISIDYDVLISDKCYFDMNVKVSGNQASVEGCYLYDYNEKIIKNFNDLVFYEDYFWEDKCILLFSEPASITAVSDVFVFHIDKNGNIVKEETMGYSAAENKYGTPQKEYNLYESNSTYKMEDLEGKPLYAERYYKKLSVEGENDCVFLTDEDDSVCVFGRQGNLYAEFGIFTGSDDTLYLMSQNGDIKVSAVHEGKESIAVVNSSSDGSEIHFFS